ncbi:hypothetical protein NDU88_004099 [Pleurodeles waltl]|uniref:Uncharacterized protein n=1 Tax=Pleurodeles waltl TaxID=8319 RepID=A0AAV7WQX5_PLEWA|nr:hypothetical protein NDU88_004099 [Pleurodeles waltl]
MEDNEVCVERAGREPHNDHTTPVNLDDEKEDQLVANSFEALEDESVVDMVEHAQAQQANASTEQTIQTMNKMGTLLLFEDIPSSDQFYVTFVTLGDKDTG